MHVITMEIPHLGNRSHLVHDESVAVVIDPPRDISVVESAASEAGVDIVAVAETHIHNDYVSGGLLLSRRHGADYLVAAEEEVEFDRVGVQDHDSLSYGAVALRVLATPGHTPLHVSFLASDANSPEDSTKALFSGGSLLEGSVGRTDLVDPALTTALTRAQWRTARRLGALPSKTRLHPTHGPGSFCSSRAVQATDGSSTIGGQHAENPALNTPCGTFMNRLLARLGPVPAHFAHMTPRNRRGAWTPRPSSRLGARAVESVLARGAQVVDIRSREKYAAGHVPGSIAVEHGAQLATYTGWVTPWGSEIVLVSDSEVELHLAERQLASIGIEGITSVLLDDSSRATWTGHRRIDWETFAASAPSADRVLLDVRRPEEWRSGHIEHSVHIPVEELAHRLAEVPAGEVWVHCEGGFRAAVAAGLLDRAGRDVVLVDDDFSAVRRIGIPVVRKLAAA
jgi:hydroxyacylglutathione hydrolase